MKVGDIVRQGQRILVMKNRAPSKQLGIVVEIRETDLPTNLKGWSKFLGRSVSIMWESGKLTKNMAENSLEVVKEDVEFLETSLARWL